MRQLLQSKRDFGDKSKRNLLSQLKFQNTMQILDYCDLIQKKK